MARAPAVDCGQRRRRRCAGPSKTSPVGRRSTASSSAASCGRPAVGDEAVGKPNSDHRRGITVASTCYEFCELALRERDIGFEPTTSSPLRRQGGKSGGKVSRRSGARSIDLFRSVTDARVGPRRHEGRLLRARDRRRCDRLLREREHRRVHARRPGASANQEVVAPDSWRARRNSGRTRIEIDARPGV